MEIGKSQICAPLLGQKLAEDPYLGPNGFH